MDMPVSKAAKKQFSLAFLFQYGECVLYGWPFIQPCEFPNYSINQSSLGTDLPPEWELHLC